MVKIDPPKLVLPGTNFSINKDPPELTCFIARYGLPLKNLDHLPVMHCRPLEHISLAKFGPVVYVGGFPGFLETTQAQQFSSTQATVASFPAAHNTQFPRTLCKVCNERTFSNAVWGH